MNFLQWKYLIKWLIIKELRVHGIMKTVKLIFLVATIVLFYSCEEERNEPPGYTANDLKGKWIYSQNGTLSGNYALTESYTHRPGCSSDYLQFNENSKFYNVKYRADCIPDTIAKGTYAVNRTILTLTGDTETEELAVRILGQTGELWLSAANSELNIFTKQ